MEPIDKSNAARARKTAAAAKLERACIKLSDRMDVVLDKLAALPADAPEARPLHDDLKALTDVLVRLRDAVMIHEWNRKLSLAILRNPAILAGAPGASASMRKLAGLALRTQKEGSLDQRTRAARLKRELGLQDAVGE